MKLRELNTLASFFLVDFAIGVRTPGDLEAQKFLQFIQDHHAYRVSRMLHHYGIDQKITELDKSASNSGAEVVFAEEGFIEIKDKELSTSFKIKSTDVYAQYFLNVNERYRYFALIKFLMSFSPYLELLIFSEGLTRLAAGPKKVN